MTPISDCEVRDPRIRRTRKLLQGALGNLLRSKSFDEISVQDITEAATLNRATFYDHYTDKFALLEAMVAGGFHEFLDERRVQYNAGCPAAVGAIIQATCDFLIRAHSGGVACERQTAFEPLMDAAIVSAIRRLLMEGLRAGPTAVGGTARAGCGGGERGHQWRGEAMVLHAGPFAGERHRGPAAGAYFAYAPRRVTSCGCREPARMVTRPSEIGREKRRGPALPGFM